MIEHNIIKRDYPLIKEIIIGDDSDIDKPINLSVPYTMKREAGGLNVTCFASWAKPPGHKSSGLWFYLKKKADHP